MRADDVTITLHAVSPGNTCDETPTGYANPPRRPGRAPAWLFGRMTRLAREIATHIVANRGPDEKLRRPSTPFGFQGGRRVQGDKGATSRNIPGEIATRDESLSIDPAPFAEAGPMAAKLDGARVQNGYQFQSRDSAR